MGRRSQALTQQRFGKVIRLFAPLYLSNECINNCKYCGFSRDNPILRVTLSRGGGAARGARRWRHRASATSCSWRANIRSSSPTATCAIASRALHRRVCRASRSKSGRWKRRNTARSSRRARTGWWFTRKPTTARSTPTCTPPGRSENFDWRLETPERAYAAGFRRLGIGALYGLADWRFEAICVAAHADYLLRNCWKASLTISLPRLRPCAGEFQPLTHMTDRELVQLVCAFRLMFPDVGLVLSTREPATLRDGLIPLGITLMSAGSHTEPGGYTGAGKEQAPSHRARAHRGTRRGASEWAAPPGRRDGATGQFDIADERSADEVAELIRRLGYEPVWKDWDCGADGLGGSMP